MMTSEKTPLYYTGKHYDNRCKDLVEDLPFWVSQAGNYGQPVLELACGTGRISIPLAEAGFQVIGIDFSVSMLALAKEKSAPKNLSIEWVKADIRDFDLEKKFPLIIFPFNSICHILTIADLEKCLSGVKKHLEPAGKFILDVFNPCLDILTRKFKERFPHSVYEDPSSGKTIVVTESNIYDRAAQINHIILHYNLPDSKVEKEEELNMRIYYPQELEGLLKYNGFSILSKYGDYNENPFRSESPKQILVCAIAKSS